MKKLSTIILFFFLNTIYSFGFDIPDQYFYSNFGYGAHNDGGSLVNGLPHNIGYNLTLFGIMNEEIRAVNFIYPFGLKMNVFIEYEGINFFDYEKYIPPNKNIKGYYISVDGYYTPRINSGIEIQLFVPYIGLIPAYNFYNNNFQLFIHMLGELGWYLTNELGLRLSLAIRTPDLRKIKEDSGSINLLLGIIYNPFRRRNIEHDIKRRENEERLKREQQERIDQMQREMRARARQESGKDYARALETTGVVQLAEYINKWGKTEYFQRESYIEIARRLSLNNKMKQSTKSSKEFHCKFSTRPHYRRPATTTLPPSPPPPAA